MAVLTVDILQMLQERLGKEEAKKVAEAIELAFQIIEKRAEEVALQKKLELREDLTKELITKAEFYGETKTLRQEIELVRQEMQTMKVEIEGKIKESKSELEGKIKEVESKLEGRINEVEYKLESRINEVESKLSARMDRLEIKFNFMILLLIIALTLMNPVVAEIIKNLLMK